MLDKTTLNQLHDLKLQTITQQTSIQQEQPDIAVLTFDERLGVIEEAEWRSKRSRRIQRYAVQGRVLQAEGTERIYEAKAACCECYFREILMLIFFASFLQYLTAINMHFLFGIDISFLISMGQDTARLTLKSNP